ncbi:MAG: type II toxin-antitoxin system RatA family toxin [Asticcacaulis sp.]
MPRHTVRRVLPYSPDQLFTLVGDVRRYPEFVTWISAMRVWDEKTVSEGVTTLEAEAAVGFKVLNERFTTRVTRDAGRRRIDVALVRGPFRHLSNVWVFVPHPGGCEVQFEIDFAFKSPLLDMMLQANFDKAVSRLMASFEARARTLYGATALNASGGPAAG